MTWKTGRMLLSVLGGAILSAVISYGVNHFFQERYRRITSGPDTTVITGPRLADGRIDFLTAVNQKLSEGVTTENNAAIPLYLATDSFWTEWRLDAFRQAIGVKESPIKGETYVDFATFMFERELKGAKVPQEVRNLEYDIRQQWNGKEEACMQGPWKPEEHPEVHAWLKRNKSVLDLVREAGRRERYFMPLIGRPDLGTTMFVLEPSLGLIRGYANVMAVDAMLALGTGDFARWRDDVLTQKRLGRHMMHSASVIGCLVGVAISSAADETIARSLATVPINEVRVLLTDLRGLPRIADVNDCLDRYERLGTIGEICTMAYFGPAADVPSDGSADPLPRPRSLGFQPPVHFDDLLREYNALVDRRVAAGRTSPYSARKAAFARLSGDCRTLKATASGRSTTAAIRQLILVAVDRSDSVSILQDRMLERARLTELALQMVIYRGEHGSYPDAVGGLGDALGGEQDLFADEAPVHYVAHEGILYSVGPNQRDDKGVYDRPVNRRQLSEMLSAPATASDYPDDIAVKLP